MNRSILTLTIAATIPASLASAEATAPMYKRSGS